jgi:hypothetical protein
VTRSQNTSFHCSLPTTGTSTALNFFLVDEVLASVWSLRCYLCHNCTLSIVWRGLPWAPETTWNWWATRSNWHSLQTLTPYTCSFGSRWPLNFWPHLFFGVIDPIGGPVEDALNNTLFFTNAGNGWWAVAKWFRCLLRRWLYYIMKSMWYCELYNII